MRHSDLLGEGAKSKESVLGLDGVTSCATAVRSKAPAGKSGKGGFGRSRNLGRRLGVDAGGQRAGAGSGPGLDFANAGPEGCSCHHARDRLSRGSASEGDAFCYSLSGSWPAVKPRASLRVMDERGRRPSSSGVKNPKALHVVGRRAVQVGSVALEANPPKRDGVGRHDHQRPASDRRGRIAHAPRPRGWVVTPSSRDRFVAAPTGD